MIRKERYNTGDINFACSLMALGVPLCAPEPCTVIAHENGSVKSRYHFEINSINGRYNANDLSKIWSHSDLAHSNHPLLEISKFIKSSVKGLTLQGWFEHALDTFSLHHLKSFELAEKYVQQFPNNPESYCLAFVLNRHTLMQLHHKSVQKIYMSNQGAHAIIDIKAPKHVKQELTNRLNG
jgi:hypothetical protein